AAKLGLTDVPATLEDRIVAEYDYLNEDGRLLFQVVRLFPKDFRQRRPDGAGGWIWDLNGFARVLYKLPELLTADRSEPVYIVEGEKDTNRLTALGIVATTAPMGAGKWLKHYGGWLRGRRVILVE